MIHVYKATGGPFDGWHAYGTAEHAAPFPWDFPPNDWDVLKARATSDQYYRRSRKELEALGYRLVLRVRPKC